MFDHGCIDSDKAAGCLRCCVKVRECFTHNSRSVLEAVNEENG